VGRRARPRIRIGPSAPACQPHQKPAQDENPIGRLKRKKLDPESRSMSNGGRVQGFGLAPSYSRCARLGEAQASDWFLPTPLIHFPRLELQCVSPCQKHALDWNPDEHPKRSNLDSEVGSMCCGMRSPSFDVAQCPNA
jgi:hypothetical protein